jgi:hypothetical protein
MQLLQMIWNGISGLGAGTVLLKALYILFLGGLFWMACKLAIAVRGWTKDTWESVGGGRGGTYYHNPRQ